MSDTLLLRITRAGGETIATSATPLDSEYIALNSRDQTLAVTSAQGEPAVVAVGVEILRGRQMARPSPRDVCLQVGTRFVLFQSRRSDE